ncbi:MAG: dethiobiotin synthase [Oxalobacter sp.]|jgi:dethiobiotin synthetase|nr:dethiobiotin synthase [Oxalobacter sp.]
MNRPAYFITGTDTGVGKTAISCAIISLLVARGFKVAAMKPVAAGGRLVDGVLHNEDVDSLIQEANVLLPQELVCPFLLKEPASPNLAAAIEARSVDVTHIATCFQQIRAQAEAVVVEGVGGFYVPLADHASVADLALALGLPVILVVGLRLGCINHALLTSAAIRAKGLKLAGWVANHIDPSMIFSDGNIATLEKWLDAPRLGTVPYLQSLECAGDYLNLDLLHEISLKRK